MGIMGRLFGAADPATGRKKTSGDSRMRGVGRGRTTRAGRGKVPPGRGRFGLSMKRSTDKGMKRSTGKGRGRSAAPSGMGKLLGAFGGRH
jgi:hypothetical protein